MKISVQNLNEFNAAISRYAAVRGTTFKYASLRAVKNWLFYAYKLFDETEIDFFSTKSKIYALRGEVRLVAYLLRRIAMGEIGKKNTVLNTTPRISRSHLLSPTNRRGVSGRKNKISGKRGYFYSWKDARKFADKRLKQRDKAIGFVKTFPVLAQKWVKKNLKAIKDGSSAKDLELKGKSSGFENRSQIVDEKKISSVEIEVLYMLRNAKTEAGKSTEITAAKTYKLFQRALKLTLPIAIKDIQDYIDKELAKT